jgi:hypothetical protein
MVNFEIPSSHTLSASEGTPHLTINREATIDLDSSNAFEGMDAFVNPHILVLTSFPRAREVT